ARIRADTEEAYRQAAEARAARQAREAREARASAPPPPPQPPPPPEPAPYTGDYSHIFDPMNGAQMQARSRAWVARRNRWPWRG
ncbi:MAG: hypothetical protein JO326_11020, partial [Acetobacteraceae bacterium]|nr:hypothetical protein [Acetobacteraceae bacterium]